MDIKGTEQNLNKEHATMSDLKMSTKKKEKKKKNERRYSNLFLITLDFFLSFAFRGSINSRNLHLC